MSLAATNLAIVTALAGAQNVQLTAPEEQAMIVVTANRLSDTEHALKDCISRHCPPGEDIKASLALAENQFVAGDYHGARATLLASRGRNKRFAKQYPVPVSDLLRANARIAAHLGLGDQERIGYFDMYDTIRAGLPEDDPRVLQAKLEVGDVFARFAQIDSAQEIYRAVAKQAQKLNIPNVKGSALLRSAVLFGAAAEAAPAQYQSLAVIACNKIIEDPDPRLASFVGAARLLKARLAERHGDSSAIDKLIGQYQINGAGNKVVLLDAPQIDLSYAFAPPPVDPWSLERPGDPRLFQSFERFDDQWVDIAFYVRPNGKVADADVLRSSPKLAQKWWIPRVLVAINGRRYAPLKRDPNDPGILRVERFTLTSRLAEAQTGTRISRRNGQPRIESLDLSTN